MLSAVFVRDILQNVGPGEPRQILALIAQDVPFEEEFTQLTLSMLAEAEPSFWARQTFRTWWVPVATSSAVFWMGIALLAVYAFKKQHRCAISLKKLWEEEKDL